MKLHPLGARLVFVLGSALLACAPEESDGDDGQAAAVSSGRDKDDPANAREDRKAGETTVWGRRIALHLSGPDNGAWATIDNGSPDDEAWLDRSYDGGQKWEGRLGKTKIPSGRRDWRTMMFGVDDAKNNRIGAVRACGKAGNRDETSCTAWSRVTVTSNRVDAAATALMEFYDSGKGLWRTTGWWNAANVLTALIDYEDLTGNKTHHHAIANTFDKNKDDEFTNEFMDDTAWWGLAWVRAYDLTKDRRYLDMARHDADYLWKFKDAKCGGGIWWTDEKTYKNAITNELFIKLAAALHNRLPGDTQYLSRADEVWRWFAASGLINGRNLINDGLDDSCKNNGRPVWSYNQGVILGGLVELHRATGDDRFLDRARELASASTNDGGLNPDGVLLEPCERSPDGCGVDGPTFKGVFARNLGELDRYLPDHPYRSYLQRQADVIHAKNRNSLDQYGLSWAGPFDQASASRQQSALEALTAAR